MQTLQKPEGAQVESRKSSTCQPGRVSIKYSDMLLVWSATKFSPALLLLVVIVGGVVLVRIGGCGIARGAAAAATEFLIKGWDLWWSGTESQALVKASVEGVYWAEVAESLTPVRRNLLCFWVCSLAVWIGKSHSLHRIALSCWQNKKARLSYVNTNKQTNPLLKRIHE